MAIERVFLALNWIVSLSENLGFEDVFALGKRLELLGGLLRAKKCDVEGLQKVLGDGVATLLEVLEGLRTQEPQAAEEGFLQHLDSTLLGKGVEDPLGEAERLKVVVEGESRPRMELATSELYKLKDDEGLYLVSYDILSDARPRGASPCELMRELYGNSAILSSAMEVTRARTKLPFYIVVANALDPQDFIASLSSHQAVYSLVHSWGKLEASILSGHSMIDAGEQVLAGKTLQEEHEGEISAVLEFDGEEAPKPSLHKEYQAVSPTVVQPKVSAPPSEEPLKKPKSTPKAPQEPKKKEASVTGKRSRTERGGEADTIRVRLKVLDRLMTLAGELVLTRNQLMQSLSAGRDQIEDATQRIDLITTELQDAIMATRMQSVGVVFHKFRRLVRDIAGRLDKEVDLVLEGEDVELDRTIIEAISDPLTHLVRNALDHGLESTSEREVASKSKVGRLLLRAYHKAGNVIIEVADDGHGINTERVKEKALEKGLFTRPQLDAMTEQSLMRLIFKPGFSTSAAVTDLSGRGVGMDVVVSNLNRVGGVVDLESVYGKGTTFRIKLPLTLAIIPCLLVTEEGERFAIPQASLVELQRIPAHEVTKVIEKIGGVNVIRLRGELLPLVRLRDVLGMASSTFVDLDGERYPDRRDEIGDRRTEEEGIEDERRRGGDRRASVGSALNIAIVAAGDFHYGLILESLLDSAEIVVKPLGRHLRGCQEYAGATILGDGTVALILDVMGLSKAVCSTLGFDEEASRQAAISSESSGDEQLTVVLVEHGETRFAVPLGLVLRIERIAATQIRFVAGVRTLIYRGGSLPLIDFADYLPIDPLEDSAHYNVIIYRMGTRQFGLLISRLVDILEAPSEVDESTHKQEGVFGSLLIDDQITLLADIHGLARAMLPDVFGGGGDFGVDVGRKTFLVVDDSTFFRTKLVGFIEELGHNTLQARNGLEAFHLLNENASAVDLVLTDIEMPECNGFELAQQIRAESRFDALPILAVTSLVGEEAERRGKQAGIDEYMIKLDKDTVLERANHYLQNGRELD